MTEVVRRPHGRKMRTVLAEDGDSRRWPIPDPERIADEPVTGGLLELTRPLTSAPDSSNESTPVIEHRHRGVASDPRKDPTVVVHREFGARGEGIVLGSILTTEPEYFFGGPDGQLLARRLLTGRQKKSNECKHGRHLRWLDELASWWRVRSHANGERSIMTLVPRAHPIVVRCAEVAPNRQVGARFV